ncbi:MAG: hypothetical protein LUF68_04840 [Clostridiales bacterium]|nr:hypothetical protein [Clostridiales bacterium]
MKMKVFIPGNVTINVNCKAGAGGAAELRIFEKMLEELTELLEELPDEEPVEPSAPTMEDDLEDDLEDFLFLNGTTFTPYDLVMVIDPTCGASAMTAEDSREVLDVFEGDEVIAKFPFLDLKLACKPDAVVAMNGRKYLTGTAVVFDALGSAAVSLDQKELRQIGHVMESQCRTIIRDGQPTRVLPL